MKKIEDLKIGIVGSGNVAHHLAHAFYFHPDINFAALSSRNKPKGRVLADAVEIQFVENLEDLDTQDLDVSIQSITPSFKNLDVKTYKDLDSKS